MKKKILALGIAMILLMSIFPVQSIAVEISDAETQKYGEYETFKDLYDAYFEAVENGDVEKQIQLEEIAERTLQQEIEEANNTISLIRPRVDPEAEYYKAMFPTYFYSGYWEMRDSGICLTLNRKSILVGGTSESINNAWIATYFKFSNSSNWQNTSMMEKQFYCHARLAWSVIESEWNLEPWKTSMNVITCN